MTELQAVHRVEPVDRREVRQGDRRGEPAYFNDGLPFGLANGVGPEVTEMKKKGVDFILSCLDVNGMKTLAAELQRQRQSGTR